MVNAEVYDRIVGNAQEKKILQIEEKISNFDEKIAILMQKIEELSKKSEKIYLNEKQNIVPQQNQFNDFSSIENFARAMSALRNYENNVIFGYEQLRKQAQQEVINNINIEEEEDSLESLGIRLLSQHLGQKSAPTQESNATLNNFHPIASGADSVLYNNRGGNNMESFNIKEVAKQVPKNIKELIKNGTIDKKTIIRDGKAAIEEKGISIKEDQLGDLYDYIKGDSND